jgi:hypothetical protein
MRYELSDEEWTAIRPMLPNKPRGGSDHAFGILEAGGPAVVRFPISPTKIDL